MVMADEHTSLRVASRKDDCENVICEGWRMFEMSRGGSLALGIRKEAKGELGHAAWD